jgi:glycosyltransferase involved in cell wall biosynthesis
MTHLPDEIVIVDNTDGDPATEAIAHEFNAIYRIESRRGLSRARNYGLAESKSDIVVYLDDDAIPDEGWLDAILAPFADKNVSVVTGGTFSSAVSASQNRHETPRRLDNSREKWFEIAAFGGLGIGTNMALRRKSCAGWTVFDRRLGRGAPLEGLEEHHAFVALLARGHGAVHTPDAVVIHTSQNQGNVLRNARNQIAYSMLLYFEYPNQRKELLRFLLGRLRHEPLTWPRDAADPGEIISSGWWALLSAWISGTLLYIRCRKQE